MLINQAIPLRDIPEGYITADSTNELIRRIRGLLTLVSFLSMDCDYPPLRNQLMLIKQKILLHDITRKYIAAELTDELHALARMIATDKRVEFLEPQIREAADIASNIHKSLRQIEFNSLRSVNLLTS